MKQQIINVVDKWRSEMPDRPTTVFDREGYDKKFFSRLVKAGQSFVSWDENVDSDRLASIKDHAFTQQFTHNNKRYSVFEDEKSFSYTP